MANIAEESGEEERCDYLPPGRGQDDSDGEVFALRGSHQPGGNGKGEKGHQHAVSDWMEIEKERGISVTSSVLQFNYEGYCINILDTPGHQDFSEDTYRTLMAADSAVMVIDGSKGVEAQTIKLFKVCVMRGIPIFTFINKMDREARDPFELLSEIESVLESAPAPSTGPSAAARISRACTIGTPKRSPPSPPPWAGRRRWPPRSLSWRGRMWSR